MTNRHYCIDCGKPKHITLTHRCEWCEIDYLRKELLRAQEAKPIEPKMTMLAARGIIDGGDEWTAPFLFDKSWFNTHGEYNFTQEDLQRIFAFHIEQNNDQECLDDYDFDDFLLDYSTWMNVPDGAELTTADGRRYRVRYYVV